MSRTLVILECAKLIFQITATTSQQENVSSLSMGDVGETRTDSPPGLSATTFASREEVTVPFCPA